MLTEHTVARAAKAAGLGGAVHFYRVVGSTNTELLRLAEEGAPGWTLAVAEHQEAGRGRFGRTWVSTPGSSLLASVLLPPGVDPERAALVGLGAAACLAQACSVACGVEAGCKWPNDLVVGERKLGGVLVEGRVRAGEPPTAVVGVGVNVGQAPDDFPPELRDFATSVAMEGGRPDPVSLLWEYLMRLRRWCDPASPEFPGLVLDQYRRLCTTLGREVRAVTTTGREVEGTAVGVSDAGELVVETASGTERVGFGEVEHLR